MRVKCDPIETAKRFLPGRDNKQDKPYFRPTDMSQVSCPFCRQHHSVRKHGVGSSGLPRFRCVNCIRTFQSQYLYNACALAKTK